MATAEMVEAKPAVAETMREEMVESEAVEAMVVGRREKLGILHSHTHKKRSLFNA